MFAYRCIRAGGALWLVGFLAISLGCSGSKERAIVKGKVTFIDKHLTAGTVMFYGANNQTASAPIDKNGNYVMNDAPLGEVRITVTVPKPPPGGLAKWKKGFEIKDAPKSVNPEDPNQVISIAGPMPAEIVPISEKYAKVETSPLTFTVQKGEQTHNLPLTP